MKKDIKKNREIVNALGLNFSLKDKELKVNKADWLIPIEKAYPELEAEYNRLELDKALGNKEKSEAFASLILNWGDYRESVTVMDFYTNQRFFKNLTPATPSLASCSQAARDIARSFRFRYSSYNENPPGRA